MSDQNTSEQSNPTSAMQQTVIASGSKVKDPKRVAAGKRLGAISKQRKEEKRLERQAQQNAEMEADNEYTMYLVGGLVVVGAASCLYLNKDKLMQTLTSDKKKLSTIPEEPTSSPPKKSLSAFPVINK